MMATPESILLLKEKAEASLLAAVGLLAKGDFQDALKTYDEALQFARGTEESAFVDWIYTCRAAAAIEIESADAELVELKRILLRATETRTAFQASYSTARIYELRRDFKKALFYNRFAIDHAERRGDALSIFGAQNQSGTLLVVDSRFEEAEKVFRRALESAGPVDASVIVPAHRALLIDNLGYCLLALDRTTEGLALVHEAFDVLEAQGATSQTVIPLLDLCFGYLKLDRFAEARYFGEAGLERVPLSVEPGVEKSFLYLLGETCHLAGDAASAESYFDRLAALYPEFRNLRAYLEVFDFRNVINLRD
jgi:tetratricopeptide (TPR) repeat protein